MNLTLAQPRTIVQALVPSTGALREVVLVVFCSALIAVNAQITIPLPFTPVPITGQTLGVILTGALLGSVRGSASVLTYIGVGALGVPVFARTGGVATYGYLAGFVVAAFVVGWLAERGWDRSFPRSVAAMLAGAAVLYVPGLLWLGSVIGYDKVVGTGLLPFIPGDIVKVLLAAAALPAAWKLVPRR